MALVVAGTDFIQMPAGTTAQRPVSPVQGMQRYNTTLGFTEVYTGAAWVPIGGGAPTVETYDTGTSATWTKPSTANWVLIELWGGGGSGGRTSNVGVTGGGGGAYNSALVKFSDLVGSVTYTVGAGGAARTTNINGATGGTTSVIAASFAGGSNKTLEAYGGGGGTGGSDGGGGGGIFGAGNDAGFGGFPKNFLGSETLNGDTAFGGGYGIAAVTNRGSKSSYYGGGGGGKGDNIANPGNSIYGGGGGCGGGTQATGTSFFGGNGGAGSTSSGASTTAGVTPAGGGGGGWNANSGAGGSGRVRFTYW